MRTLSGKGHFQTGYLTIYLSTRSTSTSAQQQFNYHPNQRTHRRLTVQEVVTTSLNLRMTKACYVEFFLVIVAILHLPRLDSPLTFLLPQTRVREPSRCTLCSTVSLLRVCQWPLLHTERNLRLP